MRLLYCGSGWLPVVEMIRDRLPEGASIEVWDRRAPLTEAVREVNVILPSNGKVDAEAIAAARALRLVQQPAAGFEGLELEAARRRGVPVCNAPGANRVAVAEAALHLILSLARRQKGAARAFRAGDIGVPLGIELRGRTLGVVGLGRSGGELRDIAEGGLGMRVVWVTSKSSRAELERLLGESDVVSLHCPLTPKTRGLFDDRAFSLMKPGALLVNCARGAIVDRHALLRALERGRLGGVGLDTYWREPWEADDPLYARDDVVTLPHVAGSTVEAFGRIADIVCDNVARVARGEPPLYQVS